MFDFFGQVASVGSYSDRWVLLRECILPLCDPEISITEFLLLLNSIYAKANSEKKKKNNQSEKSSVSIKF